MATEPRIYLDNAATSWPKPECVYRAMDKYQRDCGAAAARGGYRSAVEASSLVAQLRTRLKRVIGAPAESEVVFGLNATDALNQILQGVLREGDHVVTSDLEHNSVLRPLHYLQTQRGVDVNYVPSDALGRITPADVRAAIRPQTKLVLVSHASNVTGTIQPLGELADTAHRHGAWLAVDAAQSLGQVAIDVRDLGIDLLAASGHKSILGPLGTGFAWFTPEAACEMSPIRFGGSGSHSERATPPENGPERYEAGNLNMVGLAGLNAGAAHWEEHRTEILARKQCLTQQALEEVRTVAGARLLGAPVANDRVGLVTVTLEGWDVHEAAMALQAGFGIEVRAGLHCAPRIHTRLAAPEGSLRASWGPFTTEAELLSYFDGLRQLCG